MSKNVKTVTFWVVILTAASHLPAVTGGGTTEEETVLPSSKVDMQGFLQETTEVAEYRRARLVGLDQFLKMAQEKETIVLDTRSAAAYERKHLAGAVHLNFSDFTAKKLAKVIPSPSTRILIYCNNNFDGDGQNFASKKAPLALNIPTFVNLCGYGYRNVYELAPLVSVNDPRLVFEGSNIITSTPDLAAAALKSEHP